MPRSKEISKLLLIERAKNEAVDWWSGNPSFPKQRSHDLLGCFVSTLESNGLRITRIPIAKAKR